MMLNTATILLSVSIAVTAVPLTLLGPSVPGVSLEAATPAATTGGSTVYNVQPFTKTITAINDSPTTVYLFNDGHVTQDATALHFELYAGHDHKNLVDCHLEGEDTEDCLKYESFGGATFGGAPFTAPAIPWYTVAGT